MSLASVTYHLHSQKPLFKRAIAMSGTSLLIQALPYEEHEDNYKRVIAALGLRGAAPADRVKALLEIPGHELVSKLPPSILTAPALDNDLVLPGVTYAEVQKLELNIPPGRHWCQDLMIGDNQLDVIYPPTISATIFSNVMTGKHFRIPCTSNEENLHDKIHCRIGKSPHLMP